MVPEWLHNTDSDTDFQATAQYIKNIELDTAEATDNILAVKISQAYQTNKHHSLDPVFAIGNWVMLLTMHQRREFQASHKNCVAKFMLWFDSPYTIVDAHADFSIYTLNIPLSNAFQTFYTFLLHKFIPNNPSLFSSYKFLEPGPIVTADGLEEHSVDCIVDERKRGQGKQYLVQFKEFDPSHNRWISGTEMADNAVLDNWERLQESVKESG